MTFTDSQLLDLTVAQRTSSFRFDLLDKTGDLIGTVQPDMDKPPQIDNDTTRAVKRQMKNFVLLPGYGTDIDFEADRVRPMMVLENGSVYPLGVFLFADRNQAVATFGNVAATTLFDQALILEAALGTALGLPPYTSMYQAMVTLLAEVPILGWHVDGTPDYNGAPLLWTPETSTGKVLSDIAGLVSFYDVYFDNNGILQLRFAPAAAEVQPNLTYLAGGRMYADTIVLSDNLLQAPNRFVVIDTAASQTPVTAVYDLPAVYPNSFQARGFRVTKVYNTQGLLNSTAALAAAQAKALVDAATTTVSFSGPPDPRHDTFDVLNVLGQTYLEVKWAMTLREGDPMTHEARRVYG